MGSMYQTSAWATCIKPVHGNMYQIITNSFYHTLLSLFFVSFTDKTKPKSQFVHAITYVCNLVCPKPAPNPFIFQPDAASAHHNGCALFFFSNHRSSWHIFILWLRVSTILTAPFHLS
jgi:hypothetical protein